MNAHQPGRHAIVCLAVFPPSAQSRLGAVGIMSHMRPSVIDERGLNVDLIGAAVPADKVASGLQATA